MQPLRGKDRGTNERGPIMNPEPHLLPSVNLMRTFGLEPDPWQLRVLEARPKRLLLNCSRQAGKSTTAVMLALGEAVLFPGTLVLMLSRSLRQSTELFRGAADFFFRKRSAMVRRKCGHELQLSNDSRIISLPCSGDTIRGFANVKVLIIDEAARVPDDLYRTVRPMLAVSGGRLICLSTPLWQTWLLLRRLGSRRPGLDAAYYGEVETCNGVNLWARMPLAEATLSIWRFVFDEQRLNQVWEWSSGRCYEKVISFATMTHLIADALLQYRGSGRRSFEK